MEKSDKQYPSKVDWWIAVLIISLFVGGIVSIGAGIWTMILGNIEAAATYLGCGLFTAGLIVVFVYPLHYTLTDTELIIRYGLLKSRYEYEITTGASPSRNILSSPALSLDRLKIMYKGKIGFFLISPIDKEAFMQDLAARTNHLEYQEGELKLKS